MFGHTKFRFLLLALPALALLFTLFRVGFLAHFGGAAALQGPDLPQTLYLGLKFDLRWAILLLAPFWLLWRPGREGAPRAAWGAVVLGLALVLYGGLVALAMVDTKAAKPWLLVFFAAVASQRYGFPEVGHRVRAIRWIWLVYGSFALGFTLLAYVFDAGSYAYIHTRLNGTLLMFLENASTSARMVWESYPVVWLTLLFLALLAGFLWAFRWMLGEGRAPELGPWPSRALHVGVSILLIALMWGKWSRYPLRWGEVFGAKDALQAQARLNPLLFFLETRRDMDGGYDLKAVEAGHALLADYFGVPVQKDAQGLPSLQRNLAPQFPAKPGMNIVFLQMESLAGFKTGILGNPAQATPFLDSLCQKGLFFDRTYVVMENTSRSMFATLFGIADVSAVENATRNPLLLDQDSVLHALDGHEKLFALGGSASWANIRGILKHNFKDIALHEEGSWKAPVVDVWGVTDMDLLLETSDLLTAKSRPFWAYLQTSGNHPPFTVPKEVLKQLPAAPDDAYLRAHGFTGREEYDSLRFMDHGLKAFFEKAQGQPWFQNTVFVLYGDHGIPRGSSDKRFGDLTLAIHHIPFLIYGPGLGMAPRRISTVGSQMDILPTVMDAMGLSSRTRTLGKSLLDPAFADKGVAFTFTTFRRPPRIGLLDKDWYVNVDPDGKAALFSLNEADPKDRAAMEPERAARMKATAQAIHAWSHFLLSHNKPEGKQR